MSYEHNLKRAFNLIDKDRSGSLEKKELLEVLKISGFGYQDALELSAKIDKSKDGKIQLKEFLEFFANSKEYQVKVGK